MAVSFQLLQAHCLSEGKCQAKPFGTRGYVAGTDLASKNVSQKDVKIATDFKNECVRDLLCAFASSVLACLWVFAWSVWDYHIALLSTSFCSDGGHAWHC